MPSYQHVFARGNPPRDFQQYHSRQLHRVRVDAVVNTSLHLYRNNVITENGTGLLVELNYGFHDPTWRNNLLFDNGVDYVGVADQSGINGNISADPLFVDSQNQDFHLLSGSPAIDAGDSASGRFRTRISKETQESSTVMATVWRQWILEPMSSEKPSERESRASEPCACSART